MFRFIARWWKQRQRDIDHDILFSNMRYGARSREHFLEAAKLHIITDPAWDVDYDDLSQRDRDLYAEIFGR